MSTRSGGGSMVTAASPARVDIKGHLAELLKLPPSYYLLILVVIATAATSPNLLKINVLFIFLRQAAPLGIAVLGQLLVMRARSIDLSIGGIFVMTNYMITAGVLSGYSPVALIVVPIAMGLVIGLLNGILIAQVRASAVIVTLGMTTVLTGLVLYLSSGRPPGGVPAYLKSLSAERFGMVPLPVLVWVVLSIVLAGALRFFIFGRFLAAVGDNPRAARMSGLPLPRVIVVTHVLSGLLAAAGGVLHTAALGVGSVKFGPEIIMNSIAATILGGGSFGSGRGGVSGPFVAVVALTFMFAVLTVFGVQDPGKLMIQGVVIAVAAVVYGLRAR
jgi:ribose transport system permease protein